MNKFKCSTCKYKKYSRHISYALFLEGKTIKEIAEERELKESTIGAHMLYHISKGNIDVVNFIDNYKIELILNVINRLDIIRLNAIKEELSEDFTYSDIRFVLADYEYQQSIKEK